MILLTADIHINLRHKKVPLDWAINRYRLYEKQINKITENVDLHIIAGDIFDKTPNMEELKIFFEWVSSANVRTIIFDGNHEATKKGETFLSYLKETVQKINPLVEIVDKVHEEEGFIIVPYRFIHDKNIWNNLDKSKVVFSHIRGEIPPHVKPEINLDLIEDFPVVYLGDLHSHSNCQYNMVYPGSPMTTSFHRNKVSTGYILIDSNDLTNWSWHELQLPQLIRKTVSDPDEMIATDYDLTLYELEGDINELSQVKNTDLLDKKITKRSTDAALILDKDMTIEDELIEYLTYILELPDDTVKRVLGRFNEYKTQIA